MRLSQPLWILVIPFLLLAAWLAARQMTTDAFSSDEVASMIVAGGAHFGPFTPIEAWNRVAEHSPDQAIGQALILSTWGRIFGWSEFSVRVLPFFAGLLALAWVYRAGRDLFSPAVGLLAAACLALSVFFVTYMRVARVFSIVALLVPFVLWCYWRVVLHPRKPGIAAQVGLVAGSIGLLYAHYFGALLLLALGLYHLLLVPKNARWWRAVLLVALAALAFLPEFNVFMQGYQRNLGKEGLHEMAMSAAESVSQLVFYLSNGSLLLPETGGLLLLIATVGATGIYILRRRWTTLGLVLVATVSLLILILGANAVLQVMTTTRIRYMMPLWPLLVLLIGVGLMQLAKLRARMPWIVLAVWLALSLWVNLATDLQYQFDKFTEYPLHRARQQLLQNGAESDLLVLDGFWWGDGRTREFYLGYGIAMERAFIYPETATAETLATTEGHLRVWIAAEDHNSTQSANLRAALEGDFVDCTTSIDEEFLILDLYARAAAFCPGGARLLSFGDNISLVGMGPLAVKDGSLPLDMAWLIAPDVPPETYSVGLYVFAAGSNDVLAQVDYGLPPAPFAPVQSGINLSDLLPGQYHLGVSVYDWRTVQPLPGIDRRSDKRGPVLTIGTFRR